MSDLPLLRHASRVETDRGARSALLILGLAAALTGPVWSTPLQAQDLSQQGLNAALSLADSLAGAGRWEEAESHYMQALALAEEHAVGGVSSEVLEVLHRLSLFYRDAGRLADEAATLERLVENAGEYDSPWNPGIAEYLFGLSFSLYQQRRHAEAVQAAARGLEIAEFHWENDYRVGQHLNALAVNLAALDRWGEAEPLYLRSLAIFERQLEPDDPRTAAVLDNLAQLYVNLGQVARAESAFRRALDIRTSAFGRSHPRTAVTMLGLAGVLAPGDEQEALLLEAAAVPGETAPGALLQLGSLYLSRFDLEAAHKAYERADSMIEAAPGSQMAFHRPDVKAALGAVRFAQNDLESAERLTREALALHSSGGQAGMSVMVSSFLATVLHAQGRIDEAIDVLTRALSSLEELRPRVSGSDLTLSRFFGTFGDAYDDMVALQLEQGDVAAALEWSERGRARTLLDQLAAADVDPRTSIPPAQRAWLEGKEQETAARRAELENRITVLQGRDHLTPEEREARLSVLRDSLRLADEAFLDVYRHIKNTSAVYRAQVTDAGSVVTLAEASALVPEGGYLLVYQIGESESHLIAIPSSGAEPGHWPLLVGEPEAPAMGTEAGPLTEATLAAVLGGPAESAGERSRGLVERTRGADAGAAARALHALWRSLVPEDLRPALLGSGEVVIVPDGWLHQLPFEALVVRKEETGGPIYWLDAGPVIRYAPSVTVLHNLEARPPSASRDLLTLSDPIFDPAEVPAMTTGAGAMDPEETAGAASSPNQVNRAAFERGAGALARLPGTARETEAILASFAAGDDPGSIAVLQRAAAREPAVRAATAGKRYVHLATHGLVDERRNDMFVSLALTPPPGASTDPGDDGFLQLHEIYELPLQEADLAILSACETNLGAQPQDGEGVFALSRGFLAAGARRVIASQWAVDDVSTAELMGAFFRTIADEESSGTVNYARALRDAKRVVRSDPLTADPFFWAPFILTGRR